MLAARICIVGKGIEGAANLLIPGTLASTIGTSPELIQERVPRSEVEAVTTDRTEAFSDGVFAIAATPLIPNVHAPSCVSSSSGGICCAIAIF